MKIFNALNAVGRFCFGKIGGLKQEQNSGEILGKWLYENCNLAYFHCKDGNRIGLAQHYVHRKNSRKYRFEIL